MRASLVIRLLEQNFALQTKIRLLLSPLEETPMNFTKKLLAGSVAASFIAACAFAPIANADVSATAGVASTYLWRGYDLGSGTPAVSGDLKYAQSGFYTGIWGGSGDTAAGTEYDLYAGYGLSFGEGDMFKIDVSLWNYNYPTGAGYLNDPLTDELEETNFGELSDLVVAVGVGPVTATIYDNVAGAPGYAYYTLAGGVGAFSLLIGMHDNVEGDDPVHANLNYAFNSNLTFTLSQFVADEPEYDDMKFVVSYSLPIGE
jgi:uncharacterized protein (TIGR02001 family)